MSRCEAYTTGNTELPSTGMSTETTPSEIRVNKEGHVRKSQGQGWWEGGSQKGLVVGLEGTGHTTHPGEELSEQQSKCWGLQRNGLGRLKVEGGCKRGWWGPDLSEPREWGTIATGSSKQGKDISNGYGKLTQLVRNRLGLGREKAEKPTRRLVQFSRPGITDACKESIYSLESTTAIWTNMTSFIFQ